MVKLTPCTANQDQERDHIRNPDVLAHEVNGGVPDEGNAECNNGDYGNSPFDRECSWPNGPKTLCSANSSQNSKDSDFKYDDY